MFRGDGPKSLVIISISVSIGFSPDRVNPLGACSQFYTILFIHTFKINYINLLLIF